MEISELLRRGNFNRSKIFLSRQSLRSPKDDQNINMITPSSKLNMHSKQSISNTHITDQTATSYNGQDQLYYNEKKLKTNQDKIKSLKNLSQSSLKMDKSELLFQDMKTKQRTQDKQQSLYESCTLKSEFQLTQENEIYPNNRQIFDKQQYSAGNKGSQNRYQFSKTSHQSRSSKYSYSDLESISKLESKGNLESYSNIDNKGKEQEKLRNLLSSSQTYRTSNQNNIKKNITDKASNVHFSLDSFNKLPNFNSSLTLFEQQKFHQINLIQPKETKQCLIIENRQSNPYFQGLQSQSKNSVSFQQKVELLDLGNNRKKNNPTQSLQLSSRQELNPVIEQDKKSQLKVQTRNFKSQESHQEDKQLNKKAQLNQLIKGQVDQKSNSKGIYVQQQNNKNNDQKCRQSMQDCKTEEENKKYDSQQDKIQFDKKQNPNESNQVTKIDDNFSCQASQTNMETMNNISIKEKSQSFSSILKIVKMKKKISEIVKKNQEQMRQSKEQEDNHSKIFVKENTQFALHTKIVNDLKQEKGCEMHDIYGTFNDKIKQIQSQILESVNSFQLAHTIVEQVEKEKKQSRVIDAVENTIVSIFLSLDHLERIPYHLNNRFEIDNILSQQAISLMKSTQTNIVLSIETLMIYAKYCKTICNYGKALRLYKQSKNMSYSPILQRFRMKSYKSIGQCFLNLKLFSSSLIYFGKYLECAWYLKDIEAELKAYDLIGVTYYLLGDIEKAKFYHEKMIQNDIEPEDTNVRLINQNKYIEKIKNLNSDSYQQQINVKYKKFFAKMQSIDYEDDYQCSSSEDEFKININKSSTQKKNQEYEDYIRGLSPNSKKKLESEKKRFVALYNAEDRIAQQTIKQSANLNIRIPENKKNGNQLLGLQSSQAAMAFKPIKNIQKNTQIINQFSVNRNLDNYMSQDQRLSKNQHFDYYKNVDENDDKRLKNKIIHILSKYQNNLIFALSQIHCMRERDKYKQNKRRFAFSGVSNINKPHNLTQININVSQEKFKQFLEEKEKQKDIEDKSKPNSLKQQFKNIQRFQMHPEIKIHQV